MKPEKLTKLIGQAVNDYHMIENGDRIVVGISGGSDSVAMLLLMLQRLKRVPIAYELIPVIVVISMEIMRIIMDA